MKTLMLFSLLVLSSTGILAQGNGKYHDLSLSVNGLQRYYLFYEPADYTSEEELPVVFAFHGMFSNPILLRDEIRLYEIADTARFLIAYPQGNEVYARNLDMPGSGWNSPDIYTADQDDVSFIVAMIQSLKANQKFTIDLNRVYALGISSGGHFANYLACNLSERIAATASISAVMSDTLASYLCVPTCQISVMYTLGTEDNFFPIEGDKTWLAFPGTGEFFASLNNCDATPDSMDLPDIDPSDGTTVTLFKYENCENSHEVYAYRINGGEHNWPGAEYPPNWTGTNKDINAGLEAWKFFKKQVHPNPFVPTSKIMESSGIVIFPNPTSDQVTIEFSSLVDINTIIELMDISGKVVYTTTLENNTTTHSINLQSYHEGIYLIRISNDGYTVTEKVIKLE